MDFIYDLLRMVGLAPKDTRTNDEKIADLEKQATAAELLKTQAETAWGLKQRIATANKARLAILQQAGGNKASATTQQKVVMGVLALVVIVIVAKSCGL